MFKIEYRPFIFLLIIWIPFGQHLQASERLELENRRHFHHKTFLNSDGSYSMEISAGYLHYRDENGHFQNMDRQFRPATDPRYIYQIRDGLYEIFIEKNEDDEIGFLFRPRNGPEIKCYLVGVVFYHPANGRIVPIRKLKKIQPIVSGNQLTITDIMPGVDLRYTYTDTRLKEEILFSGRGRRNIPAPAGLGLSHQDLHIGILTRVSLDSSLEAYVDAVQIGRSHGRGRWRWNFEGTDPVDFRSGDGKRHFFLPRDYAFHGILSDSAQTANQSQVVMRKFYTQDDEIFMLAAVPWQWFRSQPPGSVVFDPQIQLEAPSRDTWIESGSAQNFGSASLLRVGRGGTFNWKRSLLKFDLSGIGIPDNARIHSATCKLYWYSSWKTASGSYKDRPVFLHQLLRDWSESTVDWFERLSGSPWTVPGVGFDGIDAQQAAEDMQVWSVTGFPVWKEYNVTDLVTRWIEGSEQNYGMILWAGNEDDFTDGDEKWIISANHPDHTRHPQLIIHYTPEDLVSYTYNPMGTVDSIFFGEDLVRVGQEYTLRDWITGIDCRRQDNQTLFDVNYTHDHTGNITIQNYQTLTESDQVNYHYDLMYRLKGAESALHADHHFGYDDNGNILWKKVNQDSLPYHYHPLAPNRLTQAGSRGFAYDRNGNVITDGQLSLSYNYRNELSAITGTVNQKFWYDASGWRVKKAQGMVTSGTGYNVTDWKLEVSSAVDNVIPTDGPSMYRVSVNTAGVYGDHYTNQNIVIEDGLNIPITSASYLEYDIRAAQNSAMRASVQIYYYDPHTGQYSYSWDNTYSDQNGISNQWKTDLNPRYVNQWYHRVLPLTILQGKVVKKVFFMTNDWPNTPGPQKYTFYCDEIRIDGQDLGRSNGRAAAPTFFYEDFNDGDIHDGQPVDWVTTGSYWGVSDGNLLWSNWNSPVLSMCAHPDLVFDDFEVSFDLKADGCYSPAYWAGFAFRKSQYQDSYGTSGYMFYYRYNGEICLYKPWGNIVTARTGRALTDWRQVKIVAQGAVIRVYVDGNPYLEVTDTSYREGYFSLNVMGVGARYDHLKISGNPAENEIYYIRDTEGNVIAEYDGVGNLISEYVYGNGQRMARLEPDGTVDYYLNDHLGSARVMAGSGWSANYYPFGEIASQTGSDEDTRYDFTGQERDWETGLMYFGARYYDPGIGRWLSVDPEVDRYTSFSPYHYCYNNPIVTVDPTGKDGIKISAGVIGTAGWFNLKLNLSLAYDFRTGFKVKGSFGLGGAKFSKGLGGAAYASGTYFTGQLKDEKRLYTIGTKGQGIVGVASVSVPHDDVANLTKAFDLNQLSIATQNRQFEFGVGIGGGSSVAGGIQTGGTLIDLSHPPKENLYLNNQTGQAPADATNVTPAVVVDRVYKNPTEAILHSLFQSALESEKVGSR